MLLLELVSAVVTSLVINVELVIWLDTVETNVVGKVCLDVSAAVFVLTAEFSPLDVTVVGPIVVIGIVVIRVVMRVVLIGVVVIGIVVGKFITFKY